MIKASKWRMDEHCVKDYCQMYTLEKKKKKAGQEMQHLSWFIN